jgi:lipoyl(octanoyl) transferase
MIPQVEYQDLGNMSYKDAWDYQYRLQKELIDFKLRHREQGLTYWAPLQRHYLLFCEHPHVYTLGKSGSLAHLLLDETALQARGIDFFKINRGGDITYHGPGQIVGYPIMDMECFFTDVHRYVRSIEEAVIKTLADYGLIGIRIKEYTGVWLEEDATNGLKKRKICAIGVHFSRWVTMHGFAFNINTNLSLFDNIIPCGIDDVDKTVTSLATELGYPVDMAEVKEKLRGYLAEVFEFNFK